MQLKSRLEMEPPNKRDSEAERFAFDRHRYKVLMSLREDFLPDLEGLGERMGSVAHNRFRLGRMNGVAALQVVNQAPHIIAPDVAEKVVRFVAASENNEALVDLEVEPALLSVVCQELNSQRQERRETRITEQTLEGSQKQVLADFYERSIADLSEPVCTFVEERLLTRRGFRNLVVYEEAISAPGVTEDDIEELVKRRLVRVEERGRLRLLELTHDLLTGVVTASRDERRRRLREAEAVRKVEEQHRKSVKRAAALLVGILLAVGALGGLAWAYYAQRQASELAQAKDAAERAAAEASQQRAIAEVQRREAERLQSDSERARELAELAAAEASRQQQIADVQREEAVRQEQQAVSARAEAETAAEDALLQQGRADVQRSIAEARQKEIEESQKQVQETNDALVEALRARLSSPEATEVVGALDMLVRGSQDTNTILSRLDDEWFESTQKFVPLIVSLEALGPNRPSERSSAIRTMLVNRFTQNPGYNAPPATLYGVERIELGGSEFHMGEAGPPEQSDATHQNGDVAALRVHVSPFYLQQHEVTTAEYRRFNPSHDPAAPGDHPVANISWFDAMTYAAWLGGSLPTEAQWEFAARGAAGRMYPWGNETPSPKHANYGRTGTVPVGSFPEGATPESIHDLAGNVWEWCRDGSSPAMSKTLQPNAILVDPVGAATGKTRILKGGSYFNDERFLKSFRRNFLHPDAAESVVGFRVAWPASSPTP